VNKERTLDTIIVDDAVSFKDNTMFVTRQSPAEFLQSLYDACQAQDLEISFDDKKCKAEIKSKPAPAASESEDDMDLFAVRDVQIQVKLSNIKDSEALGIQVRQLEGTRFDFSKVLNNIRGELSAVIE
jgi:hypothetical protein